MVDTDDTRRTIHDGRRTKPGVWHKLPTGELKIGAGGALVIGVTPTRMPTAVKQYVDPHPKGGVDIIIGLHLLVTSA